MPLYWFLLVIISLGGGSLWRGEIEPSRTLIATVGLCLGWGLLAKSAALIATAQMQREGADRLMIVRMFDRQMEALRWLGLVAASVCLIGFGYGPWVESLAISQFSMAGRAGLLLLPALTIVALLWWADHQFGVANDFLPGGWRRTFREFIATFRLQMAWLIMPVLLLLLLLDVVLSIPGLDGLAGGAMVAAVALLAVMLGLPMVVRRIWKTEPLSVDPRYATIERIPALAGFRHLPAFRWDTGGRACNAMIAGFVPRCRIMVLSDQLLVRLSQAELSMIVLHELAHLRRWHVPLRMSVILPAWGWVAVASQLLPDAPWSTPLATASSVLLTLLLLRWVAHQTELDADRVACRMAVEIAGEQEAGPASLQTAARTLRDALMTVTSDHPSARRGTWLHPSVARRCQELQRFVVREERASQQDLSAEAPVENLPELLSNSL